MFRRAGPGQPVARGGMAPGPHRRYLAHRKREIGSRHELSRPEAHVAVGIKALGVLSHDDAVHRRAAAMGKAVTGSAGSNGGGKRRPNSPFRRKHSAALGTPRVMWTRASR